MQRKQHSSADSVADPLGLASMVPIAIAKPRRQPRSRRRPAEIAPTVEDQSWLAVSINYDAPRTAAYDAMWREIIERALDRLDAKAKVA